MKRLKIFVPGSLIVAVVIIFLIPRGTGAVRFKGKSVAAWFALLNSSGAKSDEAYAAFEEMGHIAVPYLIEQLTNTPMMRATLTRANRHFTPPIRTDSRLVPPIDWASRRRAATILGALGLESKAAIPALIKVISFQDEGDFGVITELFQLRAAALRALGLIDPNDTIVLQYATEALHVEILPGMIGVIGVEAARVLERSQSLTDAQISQILETLHRRNQVLYLNQLRSFLSTVAPGQSTLGSEKMAEAALIAFGNGRGFREAAAGFSISCFPNSPTKLFSQLASELLKCLADPDYSVRLNAAEALWAGQNSKKQTIVNALASVCNSQDALNRLRSIDMLRHYGSEAGEVLPILRKHTSDPVHFVAVWAAKAVAEIEQAQISRNGESRR